MKKRVFILHGWGGYPEEGWFPWLKAELEKLGFSVIVPELPDTNNPRINSWVPALSEVVGIPDRDTYFVGHSMGNQAIIRYLETLPSDCVVGGAVFVAGFLSDLTGLSEEEKETGNHWMNSKIDLAKVKTHLPKSVAIFSDNDEFVPLSNSVTFREKLGSDIVIENGKSHFSGSDGVSELASVLAAVIKLSS